MRRAWIVVAVVALGGFVLSLISTRGGPGVSPDSVSYVAAARNLAQGRGLTDVDGTALTLWPPGYPSVLAAFEIVGVAALDAARWTGAIAMAAIVVLTYLLLRRHVPTRGGVLFGVGFVALVPAVLRTTGMVWSEPLFTVLVLAFVLVLERAWKTGRWVDLAWAGALVSGAVLVRYIGFSLLVGGVVAILLATTDRRVARVRAAWFASWSLVGPALWALRNVAASQPPFGARSAGAVTAVGAASDALAGAGHLVVPGGVPRALAVVVGLAVVAVVVAAISVVVRDRDARDAVPLVVVTATGIVFAAVSRLTAGNDVNARILAPYFPLLVVVAVWLFEERWEPAQGPLALRGRRLVGVAAGGALLGFAAWSIGLAWDHGRHPIGYAAVRWERSELADAVAALPADADVFSNDPLAVSFVARRTVARAVAVGPSSSGLPREVTVADVRAAACGRDVYVAWFGEDAPTHVGMPTGLADGELIAVRCRPR